MNSAPELSGIVVHWRNETELGQLLAAWPRDQRFALTIVDNSGSIAALAAEHPWAQWITPSRNLGFGGGVNEGARRSNGRWLLVLNADTVANLEALEQLLAAAEEYEQHDPQVAMVAPRLIDPDLKSDGTRSQHRWQLRPLTERRHLLAQCLFLSRPRGPAIEPADGAAVEQPAAAALLVRRDAFVEIDGFDERFAPAWFEDVDFAQRLADAGYVGRYARRAEFTHAGGASVPSLGFARFLRIYYRNLQRFALARGWRVVAATAPLIVAIAAILRLPTLLVRVPRASHSRTAAAIALIQLATSAVTGWRWPPRQDRDS